MAIPGNWTCYFSWGCTGGYSPFKIVFNADGTFGGDFTGNWASVGGMIEWNFNEGPAIYSGNVIGGAMVGMSAVLGAGGFTGCWYALSEGGTFAEAKASSDQQKYAASGKAGGGKR